MAFMHDLHGHWQVFTLCHHDLRFIDDSGRFLDIYRALARVDLMTLHYLGSQTGIKEE
jgi:hypothetical protein